jgi:hypothetical protein
MGSLSTATRAPGGPTAASLADVAPLHVATWIEGVVSRGHLYGFRSADANLGPFGELAKQEIYWTIES